MARTIVQRHALETVGEQGSGIAETVAHHCVGWPMPHSISPGGLGKLNLADRVKIHSLACMFWKLDGIANP
jgi:hypothetical protein